MKLLEISELARGSQGSQDRLVFPYLRSISINFGFLSYIPYTGGKSEKLTTFDYFLRPEKKR